MNEWKYEIELKIFNNDFYRAKLSNKQEFIFFYKDEFEEQKYYILREDRRVYIDDPEILDCLSVCRDELLERGLLNEPE